MSKNRVFLTRRLHEFALKELRKRYSIKVHSGKIPIPREKLIKKIANVDGLICFPYDKIDKEVIDAAKNLRAISTYSVGYDHIDINYAKKRGIRIGYTPDVLTDATADLAIALMVDLLRRVTEGDRIIRRGDWKVIYGAYDYVGVDISKKTLGIVGLGRIGRVVSQRAKAFGMNVLYYNRNRLSKSVEQKLGVKYSTLNSLFSKSDVVSLHVPHNPQTNEMVNLPLLKKMKKESYIINTARGKIIKESDLIFALKKKIIAGAALDVFTNEPIDSKNPLLKLENVVLAPHIGSSTVETRAKMAEITVENLNRGIAGKKPIYSVK
ncbi:MAG: D-glycerate dehydrogenase [Crenarchaeota archaeon]|nr:MAG: D-glycerate dehydrogenase [Thermoproteota archaeon]RDJ33664.1 MAG: D-glycerate dehydrogenase [Thermoproteota archaeon]RDJ37242.1 MAG: D-glycerate dehydrogenase [Thermoproteota archaeon]RDJ39196.1 MAG: D-glycerate dehydrogenase [Thermoproteota archaeon]